MGRKLAYTGFTFIGISVCAQSVISELSLAFQKGLPLCIFPLFKIIIIIYIFSFFQLQLTFSIMVLAKVCLFGSSTLIFNNHLKKVLYFFSLSTIVLYLFCVNFIYFTFFKL